MTTSELLSESIDFAKNRERAVFEQLLQLSRGSIVLFGAGNLGRKLLSGLRLYGIVPVAFADSDTALNNRTVDGIRVIPLLDAVERWKNEALFVVTIFRPEFGLGMADSLALLTKLGCSRITSFLPLAWSLPGVLPHFAADEPSRLLAHAQDLLKVDKLWVDARSKEIFRQQLSWRLQADFSLESSISDDQYFLRDELRPHPEEFFIDGGAYDGDTLRMMPWTYRRAVAIEPDPKSAERLRKSVDSRVDVYETALGATPGTAAFNASGTMGSSRSDAGTETVKVSSLDDLLPDQRPTFLKLDIEGDELSALQGGVELIARAAPTLAICVYHRPEDIWTIPLFVSHVLPSHKSYLRIHARNGFELVYYSIPRNRCLK